MIVIRLTRKGKTNEPAYRIAVADKRSAVKGSLIEVVGNYNPSEGKKIEFNKEKIVYWMSKGAKPSDTVASLLKLNGMEGMDKFIEPRNLKRKPKKAPPEVKTAAAAPAEAAEAPQA
ncbi:MAG: 30S ribosomal protein S16 [Candidatus Gracilibacteria bacterium]